MKNGKKVASRQSAVGKNSPLLSTLLQDSVEFIYNKAFSNWI
jgi:hypothetical protein